MRIKKPLQKKKAVAEALSKLLSEKKNGTIKDIKIEGEERDHNDLSESCSSSFQFC